MSGDPQGGAATQVPPKPKQRFVWCVIACLFFWPTGVVTLYQAGKVEGAYNAGDYADAEASAKQINKWLNITGGVVILIFVLSVVFNVALYST